MNRIVAFWPISRWPRSRSLTAPTASIGSGSTISAISVAGLDRLADLNRHLVDDAADRRAHDRPVGLGFGSGERRLGRGDRGLKGGKLVLRRVALVDQRLVRLVFRLPLVEHAPAPA